MANWTDEAKEKARETRRANKAAKAAATAAREAELQALREEVERLRADTPTVARQVLEDRAAVISDQKALLTDKAAQLFKASADNMTLSKGLSASRAARAGLEMIVADRDAEIARLRLELDEMQDEVDATNIYAGELKEKLDRRSPAGGVSASTVTMAINILRTASDTLALALEDDGRTEGRVMSDDKPRVQWSATEIVGIGIDNPERVRTTENGKTVLMPTARTIKSSFKVTEEDLLNGDPIYPFSSRPSDVAVEITEVEDERILEGTGFDISVIGPKLPPNKPDGISKPRTVDQGVPDELEERAEEDLNAHPYLVPPLPPLEERTMLELNRLAIGLGISPSGNKPHLVRLLNEAASKGEQ